MTKSNFIAIPKNFNVSVDETDGHFLLSSNDNSTILKVENSFVKKENDEQLVQIGAQVKFIKGTKPTNKTERIELEIYNETSCSDNKKFCQSGVTLCCEPPHVIVGTCEGDWSDC